MKYVKQFVIDVTVDSSTDLEEVVKDAVEAIEKHGCEVQTPNCLIVNCDVSEYYKGVK